MDLWNEIRTPQMLLNLGPSRTVRGEGKGMKGRSVLVRSVNEGRPPGRHPFRSPSQNRDRRDTTS